jgi:hypothetical protein
MRDTYASEEMLDRLYKAERAKGARKHTTFKIPILDWSLPFQRSHQPPWPINHLVPMLSALKAATESYLEEKITHAEVVIPYSSPPTFREDLVAALSAIDLIAPSPRLPAAGRLMWYAKNVAIDKKQCYHDNIAFYDEMDSIQKQYGYGSGREPNDNPCYPDDFILAIDYSKAAFTGMVYEFEQGVADYRHDIHSTALGADAVQADPAAGREGLEKALNELIQLSLKVPRQSGPRMDEGSNPYVEKLTQVLLFGESADDWILNKVLHDVVGEHLNDYEKAHFTILNDHEFGGPLFAVSRATARYCLWDLLNPRDRYGI